MDEPFTITDNDGFFQLQYNDGNLISEGGFDLATGNPVDMLTLSLPLSGYRVQNYYPVDFIIRLYGKTQ